MLKIEKEEFSNACKEVLEILKFVNEEDLEKIPKFEIEILQKNENRNYEFIYNPNITMKEQNVSKLAQGIIATYFEKYTATETQKQKIRNKRIYDNNLIEKRKSEEYGQNNLFNISSDTSDTSKELVSIHKKKWYINLWENIKKFLRKKK
jgi:hypothetical protein